MYNRNTIGKIRQKCRQVFYALRHLGALYSNIFAKFSFSRPLENLIYPDFREILSSLTEAITEKDLARAKSALERFFQSVSDEKLLKWRSESQNPVFTNSVRYLLNLIFEDFFNESNIESFLLSPSSKPLVTSKVETLVTLCCLSKHQVGLKQLTSVGRKKAEEGSSEILRTCFFTLARYPNVFENVFFQVAVDFYQLPLSAWEKLKTATLLYLYIYSSPTIERLNFLQNLSRWLAGQRMLLEVHQKDPTKAYGISKLIEEIHNHIVSNLPENLRDAEIIFFERARSLPEDLT